jgi:hypothetical protein
MAQMMRHIDSRTHQHHMLVFRTWLDAANLFTGAAGELNDLEARMQGLKAKGRALKGLKAKGNGGKGKDDANCKGEGKGKKGKGKGKEGDGKGVVQAI